MCSDAPSTVHNSGRRFSERYLPLIFWSDENSSTRSQDRSHYVYQRPPQHKMLVRVEVNTVHSTDGCYARRVEEMAAQTRADCAIRICKTPTPPFGAREFRGDGALWRVNRWWAHDENWGHRHSRLNRCLPDFADESLDALGCRPRVTVRMRKLKVICSQHQDDKRQR